MKTKKYYTARLSNDKKVFITKVNKSQFFCDGHTYKRWKDIIKYLESLNGYGYKVTIEKINCN